MWTDQVNWLIQQVLYPNVTLETGLLYRRGDLITEPNVTWDCDMDGYYTIIMTRKLRLYEYGVL